MTAVFYLFGVMSIVLLTRSQPNYCLQ